MKKEQIIRAWRDPEYRASLSEAERAQLPAHPAALIELGDAELGRLAAATVVAIPPQTNTSGTAVYSYGCSCICCV